MANWDLAIALDRTRPEPLYLQLVKALEEGIRNGRFKPGDALPGTRAMAELLGVNRNTALTAYKELEAEGWIEVALRFPASSLCPHGPRRHLRPGLGLLEAAHAAQ